MLRSMKHSVMRFLEEVFFFGIGFWCAGFMVPQDGRAETSPTTVVAWGKNNYGQTNVPPGLTDVIAVAAGATHSLALKADGTVVAWGRNSGGQTNVPANVTNVIAIAAGTDHSLALLADGTVAAWGSGGKAATNVPPDLTSVVAIAGGDYCSAALRKDGTLVTWGTGYFIKGTDRDAVSVAMCGNYAAVAKKDGSIWQYQLIPTSSSNDVIAIAGKWSTSLLALTREGTLVSPNGALISSDLTNIAAMDSGFELKVALKTDGTVVCWGADPFTNTNVPSTLRHVTAVAAGSNHGLAVIRPGPAFVLQPSSKVVSLGGSTVFHATAVGIAPRSFQWQFNGADIDGATNASLCLTNIATSRMGNYQCVLTGASATATSRAASLIVVPVCAWPGASYSWIPEGLTNAIALACGQGHNLALKADGTILAWGMNSKRQINVPAGLTNIMAVAAGAYHSLALRSNGTVVAWGDNAYGQTNVPSDLNNVIAIAGGSQQSLALKANGSVVGWGRSDARQIAAATKYLTITHIAAGNEINIALAPNGGVTTWGLFSGVTSDWKEMVQVGASYEHYFGLKADGTVTVAPRFSTSSLDTGLSNIVAIAAAGNQQLNSLVALKNDGTMAYWNTAASLTNHPQELKNVWSIAAGPYHALALLGEGSPCVIRQFGDTQPPLFGATSLHVMVTAAEPAQYQWRYNQENIPGATNATFTLSNAQFSADGAYSLLISNACGSIISSPMEVSVAPFICWDEYNYLFSQYTVPPDVREIAAMTADLLLLPDGSVRTRGWYAAPPPALTNAIAVASGSLHSLALKADGTVVAWGTNTLGQTDVPPGLTNVIAIAAKSYHSLALQEDGAMVVWGYSTNTPPALSNVVAIAVGDYHDLALRHDGAVVVWGDNTYGQTNVPAGLINVVAIAAGTYHCLALKRDGTLACWGNATAYVPAGLSNVVAISANGTENLALKADGTVVTWHLGYASDDKPKFTNVVAIAAGGYNLAFVSEDRAVFSPRLLHPTLAADSFAVSIQSRSGKVYLLEYKDSLDEQNWTALPLVAGTGRELTLTAPAAGGRQRFYRVQQW